MGIVWKRIQATTIFIFVSILSFRFQETKEENLVKKVARRKKTKF